MRVYVPLTLPGLFAVHRTGEVGPAPFDAYAVTPGLREWYVSDDLEELEYAALTRAAQASLRKVATTPDAPRRRVVLAMDVNDGIVRTDPDRNLDRSAVGAVSITAPVSMRRARAVHVDGAEAEPDVSAAAEALGAADLGDDDARFVVDGVEDHELLWYGVQEIEHLEG